MFVDKKTDKEKPNGQIRKGNFKRIDFDPASSHIQKVEQFSKKKMSEKRWLIKRMSIFHG